MIHKLTIVLNVPEAHHCCLRICNHVVFTLKVKVPLAHVLHLVDVERKTTIGNIHEAMEKTKETTMKSFNNNESKYNDATNGLYL